MAIRIGIDVMGGDFFPQAPVAGAVLARKQLPEVELTLVGQPEVIAAELARQGASEAGFRIAEAPHVVPMHEHAATALRQYPHSSLMVGMKMLKTGELDAFVSAGNTGACMAAAVFGLGMIEGVLRPTIGSLYPYQNRYSYFLDVGANVDAKPEMLAQFAQIGSIYAQAMMGITQPRVALLNIGEEEGKGNQQAQATFKLLQQTAGIRFTGNAEGRDFALGTADVYVCDGFVGNILLKFGESFYAMMKDKLPNDPDVEMLNLENVGAQPFLGVNGNVLIGHGISGPQAFCNMVRRAREAVDCDLVNKLRSGLAALHTTASAEATANV